VGEEASTMSMWAVHAKRKEPEETVVELFRNVSLSPPKRVRVTVRVIISGIRAGLLLFLCFLVAFHCF